MENNSICMFLAKHLLFEDIVILLEFEIFQISLHGLTVQHKMLYNFIRMFTGIVFISSSSNDCEFLHNNKKKNLNTTQHTITHSPQFKKPSCSNSLVLTPPKTKLSHFHYTCANINHLSNIAQTECRKFTWKSEKGTGNRFCIRWASTFK